MGRTPVNMAHEGSRRKQHTQLHREAGYTANNLCLRGLGVWGGRGLAGGMRVVLTGPPEDRWAGRGGTWTHAGY